MQVTTRSGRKRQRSASEDDRKARGGLGTKHLQKDKTTDIGTPDSDSDRGGSQVDEKPSPKTRRTHDQTAPAQEDSTNPTIFTIGHGTRTLPELIEILSSANVRKLVDVRSIPRSFTNPQFNRDTLESSRELQDAHVEYVWYGSKLGGRRNKQQPHVERHTAIRVAAFRNYAGFMATSDFREGLRELKELAKSTYTATGGYVAFMCSETLWWRCHRRMISDALVLDGWRVQHLGVQKGVLLHSPWDIVRVGDDGALIYDVK